MTTEHTEVEVQYVSLPPTSSEIAVLSLNRPEAANAWNVSLLIALTRAIKEISARSQCRLLILQGKGAHFSAGADLAWMQASAKLEFAENMKEAKRLTALFEALVNCPFPVIGVTKGAAYGGAVGLLACCDYVIAEAQSRFCLSEVKLGILPAVIMPYLVRKMPAGSLRRLCLSGQIFSAEVAKEVGLVQVIAPQESLADTIKKEVDALLACSPQAQRSAKALLSHYLIHLHPQSEHTAQVIAAARSSEEAQQGFSSFFTKVAPPWYCEMPIGFEL